jgi:hypothetical protein
MMKSETSKVAMKPPAINTPGALLLMLRIRYNIFCIAPRTRGFGEQNQEEIS